ncbi:ECF transporter S component [Helicovermis profundi]|uniref:Riboflavin transporter n=1 Tax=Helicovermis profundi TaxID=3065157 RepID=A0AAU9E0F7_9FIRM|nr:ECF transporter S component [Clostridia bacterium S502]
MSNKFSLSTLLKITMLSAIAFILMFLELQVPLFPEFLKIDISDLPALIGGFAFGPLAGVIVELIKNLLHLFRTTTGSVGELANFLVGSALVLPAAYIYKVKKSKKTALIGLMVGTISMAIVGGLANYFILLPFYQNFMPLDAIIGMSSKANGAIVDMKTLILYAIVPFNLFKGIVVSFVTLLLYKHISQLLHSK